ncbi:MAG TPA: NUDIX hydrolase [Candidatus Obscuribacterales bacterium]
MTLYTRKDTVGNQRIFEGQIFTVRVDRLRRQDGSELTREIVEHPGGVVIACKPSGNEVLLIRQYRYAIDKELIELPAGRLDPGEDRLSAAKRELIEETGYQAAQWSELPAMYSAPGFCDELLTCYLATDIKWVGKDLDEDEETDVMQVSLQEAWQLVIDRKICDAKTIAILGVICHAN